MEAAILESSVITKTGYYIEWTNYSDMSKSYPYTPWKGTEEDAMRALEYEESQIDENNPDVMGKVKYGEYEIVSDIEAEADEVELIFYNKDTHQTKTGEEMSGEGWTLLDATNERYANYEHPAYYNLNTHKVLESKDGSEYVDENGNTWVLAEPRGSVDGGVSL